MNLEPVETLLKARIGLDPVSSGPGLLPRAVRARMKALAIAPARFDRYLALLNDSKTELEALVDEVVVPESWFFRDVHPFELLAGPILERWRDDPTRPPLRASSLPCARGEEPYSMAIALLDAGLPSRRFRIDAVDISRLILESARRAIYRDNAFRTRHLGFRDRHFDRTDAGYALRDDVKRTVHFHQGNILDPGLLASHPPYDVVFCRNLLIYFDDPARAVAMTHLEHLLAEDGVLFLGHSEQIGTRSRFHPFGSRNAFAYKRTTAAPTATPGPPPVKPPPKRTKLPASRFNHSDIAAQGETKPASATTANLLDQAARLADVGKHAEAAAACEKHVQTRGPSAQAFYLLGVIRQAAGNSPEAARCFTKAVYLDPHHEEALLNLALIARARGDLAEAANYERRAKRAFTEKPRQ